MLNLKVFTVRYLAVLITFLIVSLLFVVGIYLSGWQVHRGNDLAGIVMFWGLCEAGILPFVYFAPN